MIRLVVVLGLVASSYCQAVRPGTCPVLPPGTVGICVEACSSDTDCPLNQKCCSNGCGHACTTPAATSCAAVSCLQGTTCEIINGQAQCVSPSNGASCPFGEPREGIFCGRGPNREDCTGNYFCNIDQTDRFAVCCPADKPGTCPVIPPGTVGTCQQECSNDRECPTARKCCFNGCGNVCMGPVSDPCSTVDCGKKGICELVEVQCVTTPCDPQPQCRYPCETVDCGRNGVCELVQVQCFTTPCPPQPQCRYPCRTVRCDSGTECQVKNGEAVCVGPPRDRCPDGRRPLFTCHRYGYCLPFYQCRNGLCCRKPRRCRWWSRC